MKKIKVGILLLTAVLMTVCCFGACSLTGEKEVKPISGTVTGIDKYGHVDLDITVRELLDAGYEPGDILTVTFDTLQVDMPYFTGFYAEPLGMMLRGVESRIHASICINYGNFAETTGVTYDDKVTISLKEKGGALDVETLNSLQFSTDFSDYADEETFANFRPIAAGKTGNGKLYRSSSPVDNSNNRAKYSCDLAQAAGVVTVLNLADSHEALHAFFEDDTFASAYYRELYEKGSVLPLNLNFDIYSEDFAKNIVQGLEFLSENSPPYLIHCMEGRDRTGFVSIIIDSLMGGKLEEIRQDYMKSYENYYGITKESDPKKYESILRINFNELMFVLTGTHDFENENLKEKAEEFLLNAGMDAEKLKSLINNLE